MTIATIAGCGLATAHGKGLAAVTAARQTGRLPFLRRSDFIGRDYRPQLCAFAPGAALDGFECRVHELIALALGDLADQLAAQQAGWGASDLVLLLPESDAGLAKSTVDRLAERTITELQHRAWIAAKGRAVVICGDAATTITALNSAAELAASGRPVLLIAADSFACRARLNALSDADSLFSSDNPWGFVPGEAAIAALIVPPARPGAVALRVEATADAVEPVPACVEGDSCFTGLSQAALNTLAKARDRGLSAPTSLLSDWNNSRYRASELSYALVRMSGLLARDGIDPEYPAMRLGHVGSGWLASVCATILHGVGEADDLVRSLVLCSNERDGARAACVISVGGAAESR